MTETFYDVLGVSEDATTDAIEAAYREAIKEVHPDVSDEVDAAERTKRLNKAKRVLTDDTERARYDRVGHDAYLDGGVEGNGGDTSDADGDSATARSPPDGATRSTGGGGSTDRNRRRRQRRSSRHQGGATGPTADSNERATASSADEAGSESGWRTGFGSRESVGGSGGDAGEGERTAGTSRRTTTTSRRAETSDATGPSRSSQGPSWQTNGATASTAGAGADSPSARRQASAGSTNGPNADWSWNGWERTRSWAVRQGDTGGPGLHPSRLFPAEQSIVLLATTFLLYPFFVITVLFPPFPILARAAVAVCTLLMFAYLLSVPQVAIVVYGVWSLLVPLAILLVPGVSIFSLVGVVGLSATWIPLGLSVLTLSIIRP